jgi:type I site-specific restriction endonuclease
MESGRVLVVVHREELARQAMEKLARHTGLPAAVEIGVSRPVPGHKITVTTVQSMRNRLEKYDRNYFSLLIIDEAHHAAAGDWQKVINYFSGAKVLGVTATPNRADRKPLGETFDRVAFEINLIELIGDKWLVPIRVKRLGTEINGAQLRAVRGRVTEESAVDAIHPRLELISDEIAGEIWDRKTAIFLPRVDVAKRFAERLKTRGIECICVDGADPERREKIDWFASRGKRTAICNVDLLTEGWDDPSVDCIVPLRPIQSTTLYQQIIGRGLRIAEGKENCLVLDPLWLSGEIELCVPANLFPGCPDHVRALQKRIENGEDIIQANEQAKKDVEAILERRLKEAAKKAKKAPKRLIDPLSYALGIHDSNLVEWESEFPWQDEPATDEQRKALEDAGLSPDVCQGFAIALLDRLAKRRALGLATPRQLAILAGHPGVELLSQGRAGVMIERRKKRGWVK